LLALDAREFALADQYLQQALNAGFNEPNKIYFNLGRSALEQKDDARALMWYDKIGPGEQFLPARLAAANIIARSQGVNKAITMLDEVDGLTNEQQSLVIQTEAALLNQDKRYKDAFDLLEKAVQSFPNNSNLMYDYALTAERVGKFELMEDQLYKIIKMKPDSAAAYNALGYSYADRNIKLIEAKNLIETAVKLAPDDHYILDSLGWVYFRLGDLNHASERLQQAYAIQQDPEIAAHLAEVLWKQGQQEEARRILEQAAQLNPGNEALVSTMKKLKITP
jgi:tetratricopeptide (TPR) repeat protein